MSTEINKIYRELINKILEQGTDIHDKRKFHQHQPDKKIITRTIYGFNFSYDLEKHGLPLISLRKIPIKLFVGETVWFLRGDNNPNGVIRRFTKIWDDFVEDDGTVTSYGNRWRKWFGRDQLLEVIQTLQKDPSSRHGVVVTWDPKTDSLITGVKRMNVPCHVMFMFNVENDRLHMHTIWRSQDAYLGFPNDLAGGGLLQMIIAAYMGLKPGIYHHYIANVHLYDNQYENARKLLEVDDEHPAIKLDIKQDWFEKASKSDDGAYEVGMNLFEQIKKQYKPKQVLQRVLIVV